MNEVLPHLDFTDFGTFVKYLKGKMTSANKKGATRSSNLLELIHIDISGTYPIAGLAGHTSFITFIDDYSRYMYLYLIKEKSESATTFKYYKTEVEKQLDRQTKVVRSDRGFEYYGRHTDVDQAPGSFYEFCKGHGIVNQYTMPEPVITENEGTSNTQNQDNAEPANQLRRSSRSRRPTNFDDFVTYLTEADTKKLNDPISYNEAMSSDQSSEWNKAMIDELDSMRKNDVWDLVELPNGFKPVGCKWVFKTKLDPNGNVERYKARLVAKGYTQKEGIDYQETFSPVSRKDSLRIVIALVAHFDLELHQIDMKTVFLEC
ncbi:uncharacterized protein LOC143531908 [Bidens hawaiensis]|uniref:uncharacterized protein LOC143531908 n=1 Tax=Bidens hawaiensis TaxID=980011 RepID=UPI00404B9AD8